MAGRWLMTSLKEIISRNGSKLIPWPFFSFTKIVHHNTTIWGNLRGKLRNIFYQVRHVIFPDDITLSERILVSVLLPISNGKLILVENSGYVEFSHASRSQFGCMSLVTLLNEVKKTSHFTFVRGGRFACAVQI